MHICMCIQGRDATRSLDTFWGAHKLIISVFAFQMVDPKLTTGLVTVLYKHYLYSLYRKYMYILDAHSTHTYPPFLRNVGDQLWLTDQLRVSWRLCRSSFFASGAPFDLGRATKIAPFQANPVLPPLLLCLPTATHLKLQIIPQPTLKFCLARDGDPLNSKQDVAFQISGIEREKPAASHWAGGLDSNLV